MLCFRDCRAEFSANLDSNVQRYTLCRLKLTSLADGGNCAAWASVIRTMKMLALDPSTRMARNPAIPSTTGERLTGPLTIASDTAATKAAISRNAPTNFIVVFRE